MADIDMNSLVELKEFIKWKKLNPTEYKEYIDGLKEFLHDLKNIMDGL